MQNQRLSSKHAIASVQLWRERFARSVYGIIETGFGIAPLQSRSNIAAPDLGINFFKCNSIVSAEIAPAIPSECLARCNSLRSAPCHVERLQNRGQSLTGVWPRCVFAGDDAQLVSRAIEILWTFGVRSPFTKQYESSLGFVRDFGDHTSDWTVADFWIYFAEPRPWVG